MGSKLIQGVNDLKSKYPLIAQEWDYDANSPLSPENVAYSSNKKFWWICPKGHHYQTTPNSRVRNHSGCKYCANKAVLKGFNDLAFTNPELAQEWDYSKNGSDSPENYTAGSEKKFYWLCKNGHDSFLASIKNRSSGKGCPICGRIKAGKSQTVTAIKSKGSLLDLYPILVLEWDNEKNPYGPENYHTNSCERVWWKCSICNHSWLAKIASRTRLNSGCPNCNKRNKSSFPEEALYYYIKQLFPDAQNRYTELFDNKMELDVFIPSRLIGIEYDGLYWHGNEIKETDKKKYYLCKKLGITLFRIRESQMDANEICDAYIIRKDYTSFQSLNQSIVDMLQIIAGNSFSISVDSDRDKFIIQSQYLTTLKANSLLIKYPEIAAEWHPDKNKPITPDMVAAHSQTIVWWKCSECGNEYKKRISERTSGGSGCKSCSSKRKSEWKQLLNLKPGENDLPTLFPELMKEWNYTNNAHLSPEKLTAGSSERVSWICQKCGKEWMASIYQRTKGSGCPYCGRIKAGESQKQGSIQKHGTLQEKYPAVAIQWDFDNNGGVTPSDISPIDKSKKYNWICICGTRWTSTVYNLTHSKYIGCRKCRYKQAALFRKEHPESNPFYGKHHTEETKKKLSISSSGKNNYWYGKKGKLSSNYGKHFTDEHREKISTALKGRKLSEETKAKISASKTKLKASNDSVLRRVRQLSMTGEKIADFDSVNSAMLSIGITTNSSLIDDACKGKIESAYGFLWEYIE